MIEGSTDGTEQAEVFNAHLAGADFYLDPRVIDSSGAERLRAVLRAALQAIDRRWPA